MTNNIANIRLVDVDVLVYGENEPESMTVGIGDGNVVFDDDYPFDPRVFYYFEDDAEFERAFTPNNNEFGFTLLRQTNILPVSNAVFATYGG